MKFLVGVVSLCMLAACSKHASNESSVNETTNQDGKIESCNFGLTTFNLSKRAPLTDPWANKGKPRGNGNGGGNSGGGTGTTDPGTGTTDPGTTTPPPPPPPPPPAPGSGVILLDFDGHVVTGTYWNSYYGSTINCAPANMSGDDVNKIVARVSGDYAPFNIIVTTDESVYNAADAYKRMRVVITESHEWYGTAGGVAFLNTFAAGNNTPCFVFSSLLNYKEKNIAEAAAHEAGHTFGLSHQAVWSGTTLTGSYSYGTGSGEIGWAPLMGAGYYQNTTTWHNGPTASAYNAYQDDVSIIAGAVGTKADDYSNSITGAASLTSSLSGLISTNSDVDFFAINIASSKTLAAVPANIGPGNIGANLDLVMNVYNSFGQLVTTVNDPNLLNASTTLSAGQYYVSVSTTSNQYASNYGMLDRYSISLY